MILPGILRVKLAVIEYGREIAMVLAVVSLLAFIGTGWAVASPPTETTTEQTHVQRISSDATLVAVVKGETPLYDRGTRLEGVPFYPMDAAPDPTVQVTTSVPSGRSVSVDHRVSVVYRASDNGQTLWESVDPLARDERTVTNGRVVVTAPVPVSEIASRTNRLNSAFTGVTRVEVLLRMNVTYETDRYSGSLTDAAPLTVTGSGYWLGGPLAVEETNSVPVTRTVTKSPDMGLVAPLLLVGLLAAAGAVVSYRYRDSGDPAEVKHQLDLNRSHEWVSSGRIRQPISGQDISMDSLEDLVDVAIDSNRRVVFDTDRELYAVFDRGMLFYFDPLFDRDRADVEISGGTAELERAIRSDGAGGDESANGPENAGNFSTPERDAWDRLMDKDEEADDSE